MSVRTRAAASRPKGPSNIAGQKRSKPSTAHAAPASAPTDTPDLASEPVFFWRPEDPELGFLSQWHPSPFSDPSDPSIVYNTAEHYMMYHKAKLFDPPSAPEILAATSPSEVRSLGRLVPNYDDAVWAKNRLRIVTEGSRLKFTTGPEAERLRALLLATGDRELVEASPSDRIWGIGFNPEKAVGSDRKKWGMNLLGQALTAVRRELQPKDEESGSASDSDASAEAPEHH
jgi:ribA/ribD-fused uncharacterized protein